MTLDRRSLLAAGASALPAAAAAQPRAARGPGPFRRGLGVHNAMNWARIEPWPAKAYVWPPFQDKAYQISDTEIAAIAQAGFDFVRLTLDPGLFIQSSQNAHWPELMTILGQAQRRFMAAGLKTILDLHPNSQHEDYGPADLTEGVSAPMFQAYQRMTGMLAEAAAHMPRGWVALELMNEPPVQTALWQPMAEALHRTARQAAGPALILVVGGGASGVWEGLTALDPKPFAGSNVLFTFHYYEPYNFTHQGLPTAPAKHVRGLRWPATLNDEAVTLRLAEQAVSADAAVVRKAKPDAFAKARGIVDGYTRRGEGPEVVDLVFDRVAAWADAAGVPRQRVLLGEFNCARSTNDIQRASDGDRLGWVRHVRQAAETRGWSWALWAYRGQGGMALAGEGPTPALEVAALQALGLNA